MVKKVQSYKPPATAAKSIVQGVLGGVILASVYKVL